MLKMDDFWVFLILLFVFLFINYSDNKVLEGWVNATAADDECARVTVLCSGNAAGGAVDDPTGTLTYINTGGTWAQDGSAGCVCEYGELQDDTGKCLCPDGQEYSESCGNCAKTWESWARRFETGNLMPDRPIGVSHREWIGPSWHLGEEYQDCNAVCTAANLTCEDGLWGVTDQASFDKALVDAGHSPSDLCTALTPYDEADYIYNPRIVQTRGGDGQCWGKQSGSTSSSAISRCHGINGAPNHRPPRLCLCK
jgi:hypothetical protein